MQLLTEFLTPKLGAYILLIHKGLIRHGSMLSKDACGGHQW